MEHVKSRGNYEETTVVIDALFKPCFCFFCGITRGLGVAVHMLAATSYAFCYSCVHIFCGMTSQKNQNKDKRSPAIGSVFSFGVQA